MTMTLPKEVLSPFSTILDAALVTIPKRGKRGYDQPILGCAHLSQEYGVTTLRTTDLDVSLEQSFQFLDMQKELVLPLDELSGTIKGMKKANKTVSFSSGFPFTIVSNGLATAKIKQWDASDYPVPMAWGHEDTTTSITLRIEDLLSNLPSLLSTVAPDDSRPVFASVLFRLYRHELVLVSADSFQLTVRRIPLPQVSNAPWRAFLNAQQKEFHDILIPGISLKKLMAVLTKKKEVSGTLHLELHQNGLLARFWAYCSRDYAGEWVMRMRTVEGTFPQYQVIIPDERLCPLQMTIRVESLLEAVSLLEPVAKDSSNIVRITVTGESMTLIAQTDERQASHTIPLGRALDISGMAPAYYTVEPSATFTMMPKIVKELPSHTFCLNLMYLKTALEHFKKSCSTGKVYLYKQLADRPVLLYPEGIRSQKDTHHVYVVMPMTSNR